MKTKTPSYLLIFPDIGDGGAEEESLWSDINRTAHTLNSYFPLTPTQLNNF